MDDTRRVIERVARESYGRLVAYLAARTHDVAAAEDALADAFAAALATWPRDGVPGRPEGWLLTAARNRLIDRMRHDRMRTDAAGTIRLLTRDADAFAEPDAVPDDRLKLLFVCAHPAIDASVHTPLMLQVVLGLDAATIAAAFVMAPAAMGQRLSRAKRKIRDAGIAFDIPGRDELPGRLAAVLEAIYAAYGSGWDDLAGADTRRKGLTDEAVWLARVLVGLVPDEPEAAGLLALMLFCEARRAARRDASGDYVPIAEQDPRLWRSETIVEAESVLVAAAGRGRPGRFQLEAALQSAHIEGARNGAPDWQAIATLYEGLARLAPTIGVLVGRAAALAEWSGPDAALSALEQIDRDTARGYQPYWAVRAHLLGRLDRPAEATTAFDRAIELTEDPATRRFLTAKRQAVTARV